MKKVSFIYILGVIVLVLAILEQIILSNIFDYMENISTTLLEKSEDLSTIDENAFSDLEKYWDRRESFICLTVNYDKVDNMSEQISLARFYFDEQNDEYVRRALTLLLFELEGCRETLLPNFQTLL